MDGWLTGVSKTTKTHIQTRINTHGTTGIHTEKDWSIMSLWDLRFTLRGERRKERRQRLLTPMIALSSLMVTCFARSTAVATCCWCWWWWWWWRRVPMRREKGKDCGEKEINCKLEANQSIDTNNSSRWDKRASSGSVCSCAQVTVVVLTSCVR